MFCAFIRLVSHRRLDKNGRVLCFTGGSTRKTFLDSTAVLNMACKKTALLYFSIDSLLREFNKNEHKDIDGVKELLEIYDKLYDQKKKLEAMGEIKKHPLIVLEGLDGSGKTSMGKRLAKKFQAEKWSTPPDSISHLRHLFDNSALRTEFYSLGNYIAALEVQLILRDKPVVMDRYWHSTAAFALAQGVQDNPGIYEIPPTGELVYRWPNDLYKPDIVILLEVSEEVRLERHSRRKTVTIQENLLSSSIEFRQNIIRAYKNMCDPGVVVINADYSFGATLAQLFAKTKHLLQ